MKDSLLVRRSTLGMLLTALPALAACELDLSSRLGEHPEIVGVALVTEASEFRDLLVLEPGGPHRVTVEFLDARGRPISSLGSEHRTLLSWEPSGSASSQLVPGESFTHEVSVARTCAPPQRAFVRYGHDSRADEKTFGPVPVMISPQIGLARAFGPDSVQLASPLRLPSMEPFRLEIRYFDCQGVRLTGLEDDYEVLLFFPTVEFASWEAVAGAGFQAEVRVNEPSGTQGQIGFGIRRKGTASHQFFGPFPLIVD